MKRSASERLQQALEEQRPRGEPRTAEADSAPVAAPESGSTAEAAEQRLLEDQVAIARLLRGYRPEASAALRRQGLQAIHALGREAASAQPSGRRQGVGLGGRLLILRATGVALALALALLPVISRAAPGQALYPLRQASTQLLRWVDERLWQPLTGWTQVDPESKGDAPAAAAGASLTQMDGEPTGSVGAKDAGHRDAEATGEESQEEEASRRAAPPGRRVALGEAAVPRAGAAGQGAGPGSGAPAPLPPTPRPTLLGRVAGLGPGGVSTATTTPFDAQPGSGQAPPWQPRASETPRRAGGEPTAASTREDRATSTLTPSPLPVRTDRPSPSSPPPGASPTRPLPPSPTPTAPLPPSVTPTDPPGASATPDPGSCGAVLRGQVRRADGGPVAGTEVLVLRVDLELPEGDWRIIGTDGDGRYQAEGLCAGDYLVAAQLIEDAQTAWEGFHDGNADGEPDVLPLSPGAQREGIDILLNPALPPMGPETPACPGAQSALRARLSDPAGAALEGATLQLFSPLGQTYLALSGSDGESRLEGICPGYYQAVAVFDDGATLLVGIHDPDDDGEPDWLDLSDPDQTHPTLSITLAPLPPQEP